MGIHYQKLCNVAHAPSLSVSFAFKGTNFIFNQLFMIRFMLQGMGFRVRVEG